MRPNATWQKGCVICGKIFNILGDWPNSTSQAITLIITSKNGRYMIFYPCYICSSQCLESIRVDYIKPYS